MVCILEIRILHLSKLIRNTGRGILSFSKIRDRMKYRKQSYVLTILLNFTIEPYGLFMTWSVLVSRYMFMCLYSFPVFMIHSEIISENEIISSFINKFCSLKIFM